MKSTSFRICLLVIGILTMACSGLESKYGLYELKTPTGEILFLRREARGLNWDQLSLTKNANVCDAPDKSYDYIFPEAGTTLYYRFEGSDLHFDVNSLPSIPSLSLYSGRILLHEVHFVNSPEFKGIQKEKGNTYLEVPLDDSISCWY